MLADDCHRCMSAQSRVGRQGTADAGFRPSADHSLPPWSGVASRSRSVERTVALDLRNLTQFRQPCSMKFLGARPRPRRRFLLNAASLRSPGVMTAFHSGRCLSVSGTWCRRTWTGLIPARPGSGCALPALRSRLLPSLLPRRLCSASRPSRTGQPSPCPWSHLSP